jgi:hypothetical protein
MAQENPAAQANAPLGCGDASHIGAKAAKA